MMLEESIRSLCHAHGLKLNKDLGQHFLVDQEILDSIVDTADIEPQDHIVEIGPGIGVLTKELLEKAGHVTAIEIDERFIPILTSLDTEEKFTVINQNALSTDLPQEPYKIVANIPYHITSPLLRHAFLESALSPTSMTLLIQREVAEKICDTKSAGLLTILVALFGKPSVITRVPPDCFLPPPKVDSAVLHIDCFPKPKADPETIEEVFKLTKIAFSQKRKKLSNTLGAFQDISERLMSLGIDQNRRPQELSCDEWIALASKD